MIYESYASQRTRDRARKLQTIAMIITGVIVGVLFGAIMARSDLDRCMDAKQLWNDDAAAYAACTEQRK